MMGGKLYSEFEFSERKYYIIFERYLKKRIDIVEKMWYNKRKIGSGVMAISYKKLWKLLIDRDIRKGELCEKAQISGYTLNKLNHGENVNADTLAKICIALGCSFDDIMEIEEGCNDD